MLRLEGALRDIQDASASLAAMTADAVTHRRCFDQCLGHLRGAQWKIQTAVRTAARQEPGRPRVDRAEAWWSGQADTLDHDPVLRWARDAAEGGDVSSPPDTHLGRPIPAEQQTPAGLLALCIAYCGDLYDRAMRTWS